MTDIGFMYNCSTRLNPGSILSHSLLNRLVLVEPILREAGHRQFVFSPKYITEGATAVPGYRLEGQAFVPDTAPIPRVNGNWTFHSRSLLEEGLGYRRLPAWARENDVGIYVPYELSNMASDKYRTFKTVRDHDPSLHPYTERYRGEAGQLEAFLDRSDLVFLKPRWGNMGNRILVLRRDDDGLRLTHYRTGEETVVHRPRDVDEAQSLIDAPAREKRYLVQQGIETLRYDGAAFDIRVIVLSDGAGWRTIHEARIGGQGNDVSNLHQGGSFMDPAEMLAPMLGADAAATVTDRLDGASRGLADHLDTIFPGAIIEVAFDFLLDADLHVHLAEMNTKPGLAGIGFFKTAFEKTADDEPEFERFVYPHARCLGRFLLDKVEGRAARAA